MKLTPAWMPSKRRTDTSRGDRRRVDRRRITAGFGAFALASTLLGSVGLSPQSAYAAPGDPFDPADPYVYIAQGQPTGLYTAIADPDGNVSFSPEGAPASFDYNAIAYNTADNRIYALVGASSNPAFPPASLVRIGQDGAITRVGTSTYTGSVSATFGPGGLYYTYASVNGTVALQVIDVTTGAIVRVTPITGDLAVGNDMAFKDGFLWTMGGGLISRTNPANGATVRFAIPFPTDVADQGGAAWTFGNGNLGFSYNLSGTIYQVAVTDPGGATPTFSLVSANPGPPNANNDGTASPGLPTDLSIEKEGPQAVIPGGTVTYTLTVTNEGPGNSSGFVVDDVLPAPLTNVVSTDGGCTVTGNAVQCVGGRLLAGDSVSYTITAVAPAGVDSAVANTATVTSNEDDPTPENNSSTHTSLPAGLTILKQAGAPVDVNGNGITDTGDTIQYTFQVTNSGDVPLTGITVADPLVGTVVCPQDSLAPGLGQLCAAADVYTITSDDVANGSVENSATATGATPDGEDLTSTPSSTSTTTTAPTPGITVVKSADLEAGSFTPGQAVTYHFVVTNTGNVPLAGITVDEVEFTGTGAMSAIDCPATALGAGGQMICEATYTLSVADVDSGAVTNSVTASGTPTGAGTPVTSPVSEVTVPTPAEPGITVTKTAAPGTVVAAGQTVIYSFRVANTGNVTLTDVAVNEVAFSGTGEMSAILCDTTTLVAGQVQTCQATYVVTQEDVDAGSLTNTATAEGTPPGETEALVSEPDDAAVEIVQAPALTVLKSADVDAVEVGQTVTYSFLVTNTGNVTMTDLVVNDVDFSGSGDLSDIDCPVVASLAPGDDVTCTATYTVTQADIDSGELTNTATVTGTPPDDEPITSPPSTSTVSTDPLPALAVTKTADLQEITAPGQVVTYTFQVRNIGNVTIADVEIDEGEFSGQGTLSEVTCPAEAAVLVPGESVDCTAAYTVVAADLSSERLTNTATATGSLPGGGSITSEPSTATVTSNPPRPSGLSNTGAELAVPAVGAATLLLLGGGLLAAFGLRRRARSAP